MEEQRGLFYFTPSYVFGSLPWRDYEVGLIMPLKNVYAQLVNVGWNEFLAYDDIPLTKDTIVLVEEGPGLDSYLKNTTATIIPFKKIEGHFEERF